ncbi:hypothetical protein Tco_0051646 [Tanacetum coccineum]
MATTKQELIKFEINTGFINGLPKKWLSFYQSLRNTNRVKDSELAFIWTFKIVQMMKRIQKAVLEYLNDLEKEYQERALLAKSKRFFKKGTQRFSSEKATDQTECHKCGKKELRPTKEFEAKYNKVKAKLALLSSSTSASKATTIKNKGLIAEAYEWDEEEVSSDDNKMVEMNILSVAPFFPSPSGKKLDGAEPISGPKTIKSILKSKSTLKAKTIKGVKINKPSPAPAKGNKSSSASKVNSAPAGKLKSVKIKDDPLLAINEGSIQEILNMPSKDVKLVVAQLIPQLITMILNGSKEVGFKAKLTIPKLFVYCDIRKPICYLDSGCSMHMTGVKSYLHKYMEQPGPKVVFRDDSTCVTEGYGSIKCNGIVFIKVAFVNGLKYNLISIIQLCDAKYIIQFDEKRGTIFNSKEILMIAPRVRESYVLDMTSSAQILLICQSLLKILNALA